MPGTPSTQSPLGSCPDWMIIDPLMPKKAKGNPEEPSTSIDEYDIPSALARRVGQRLAKFEDLCARQWR